jgi:ABC-type multidrug transport system fused ATPase/permease subunit
MSDPSFISKEAVSHSTGLVQLNLRMFRSFPLFLRLLPVTLLTIVLSSVAPSVFRWYSGHFADNSLPVRVPGVGAELNFTIAGLVILTALAIALRIAAWALFEISGMWSSQHIHAGMVTGMARTRTTFFDENPSGRLINRLVRDFDELRSTAIIFVGDTLNCVVEILSVVVIASFASPWAALLVLPLLAAFSYVQYHRADMLDHARAFAAIATSKVLGRKTDLIEGRETFLLYGKAQHLLQRMSRSFSSYVQASALTVYIDTWASFWIRITSEMFSLGVLFFTTAALAREEITPTMAGVIISSLFGITGSIGWLDFATSLVARSSPHVRRVYEFVDLPAEEAEEREEPRLGTVCAPAAAPSAGAIEFIDYTMSYRRDSPVILDKLNLRVPLGARTALVGRTGSGKTSVIQALMRMVYVRAGDIRIGGISIFDMDIRELRRLFGVVPQSPYLFAGTIGTNLDRVGDLPLERLQRAMDAVGLRFQLDHPVTEGGNNLSVGERQLVCLARVIAAERAIVLMDEPTSGLDPETDARIHTTLGTALRDKTVLTIAHRRESLGSYDFVVEMESLNRAGKNSQESKTTTAQETN